MSYFMEGRRHPLPKNFYFKLRRRYAEMRKDVQILITSRYGAINNLFSGW